ncbi:hypothetical protein PZ897_07300 [Hoeflea sp. YIM 152468]|uniref:hypothetical protein n=1 Tax=Hoeflea sp. YIM 152468 TaxID=3031759 RepID=UPI0023DC0E5E|nr:hypothetical protein [Hoeflea sp. YIM 152468]MDF1607976.1 hypothetical protein [Hoeflea sp. YIM 152468]
MNSLPEPHPLDFDWRFTPHTIEKFVEMVDKEEGILAVGTPSVARRFHQLGRDVALVDRQPIHFVDNHSQIQIDSDAPRISGYKTAIVDPPWYPEHALTWMSWAANCVGLNGLIFASVWPPDTRPTGEREFANIFEWLESWSTVSIANFKPRYELPLFEAEAYNSSFEQGLSTSPRLGRLLKIRVRFLPEVPPLNGKKKKWLRFVFNDYQLALRVRPNDFSDPMIKPVSGIESWQWPYVSRRAPGRDSIDVWSSRNEVAVAGGTKSIAEALRQAALAKDHNTFEAALSAVPAIAEWKIPRPPFRRVFEWEHRQ